MSILTKFFALILLILYRDPREVRFRLAQWRVRQLERRCRPLEAKCRKIQAELDHAMKVKNEWAWRYTEISQTDPRYPGVGRELDKWLRISKKLRPKLNVLEDKLKYLKGRLKLAKDELVDAEYERFS